MNRAVATCIAVVRPNNIGSGALNILRYDSDVDENNLKISTYEGTFGLSGKYYKKNKKLHEYLFTGNLNNFNVKSEIFTNQTLRPVGFFRKIPKGIYKPWFAFELSWLDVATSSLTHTLTLTPSHAPSLFHTHKHTHALTYSLSHSHTLTHTHTHTHSHTPSHAPLVSLSLSHTQTHTRTHLLSLYLSLSHKHSHNNTNTDIHSHLHREGS